jgi:hypothetical protein
MRVERAIRPRQIVPLPPEKIAQEFSTEKSPVIY